MTERSGGVLMHISSLPSRFGIGDLGPEAYCFADFLGKANQHYWQILPLNPTNPICGNSPYSSISAFAGNELFVSPDRLIADGFLKEKDCALFLGFSDTKCEYDKVISAKKNLLTLAYDNFIAEGFSKNDFEWFQGEHSFWLDDYALFVVIKKYLHKECWVDWPKPLALKDVESLRKISEKYQTEIEREKFFQFLFYKQWFSLKSYCNQKNISFLGDIPIYVSYDSVDVWTNKNLFKLDNQARPTHVAGVPPDYFSETGQLWGNPVYKWDEHKKHGFEWWRKRMAHNLHLFDVSRIDHFRGLVAYWEVPFGEETAINGKWQSVPVNDFMDSLKSRFPHFPIVGEDLGVITDDVRECLHRYEIPGMKILMFAFGGNDPNHPYKPHNYSNDYVVYTGTHDNNTTVGWFENDATKEERDSLSEYVGKKLKSTDVNWAMIRLAFSSVANIAIIPMQDLLGLGSDARMNTPSVGHGNWAWRMKASDIKPVMIEKLKKMSVLYGRVRS